MGPGTSFIGNGTTRWAGGTLAGNNLTVDTALELEPANLVLSGITLTHTDVSGGSRLRATQLNLDSSAVFDNAGTLLVDSSTNTVTVDHDAGFGGEFRNSGLLNIAGINGFQVLATGSHSFTNPGSIDVQSGGALVERPFTNAGTINTATGTSFRGTGASFVNDGTLTGTGTFLAIGPSLTLVNNGTIAPAGAGTGTLNVVGDLVLGTASTIEAQIAGAAPGSFDQLSIDGDLVADGVFDLALAGGFTPGASDSFPVISCTGSCDNGGFATFVQPVGLNPSLLFSAAVVEAANFFGGLTNSWTALTDGLWDTAGNWSLGVVPDATMIAEIDTGLSLEVTIPAGFAPVADALQLGLGDLLTLATGSSLTLDNDAQVAGTLTAGGLLSSSGNLDIAAAGALDSADLATIAVNAVVNAGTVTAGGGLLAAPLTNSGTLNLNGATTVGAALVNTGTMNWNGGNLQVNAAMTNSGTMNINAAGVSAASGGGAMVNNGTINKAGAGAVLLDALNSNAGTIAVSGAGLDIGSGFSNAGLLDVDAAMSISAPDFQNSGTLDLNDTLTVANMTNAVGGTVQGNGTIVTPSNPLTNAGRLSPGNSPGLLTINGDLVMLPTSIVDFELNDITQPGINYDSIFVTGTATLAGTLDVTLAPGFFPAPGTQIPDVVTYTTVVNDFQIINGPVVPAEQQFSGGDVGGVSYTLLAGSIFFPPDPVEVAPTAVAQPVVEAILVLDNNEPAGPEDLLADVADEAQVVLLLGDEGGTEVPLFTNRPPLCAP